MTWAAPLQLLQVSALASLALAAVIDLKTRTIPNALVLCVMVAGLTMRVFDDGPRALESAAIALAMLVALVALARRGHIGGGDAKMIAATTLLVEPSQVLALITAIALAGGVLAILYFIGGLASRYAERRRGGAVGPILSVLTPVPADRCITPPIREKAGRGQFPYGVAILAGAALALVRLP